MADQIPIVDAEGNWFNIDPQHQQEAIEKGYRIPSPEEAVRHDRMEGTLGNIAALAGSTAQGLSFGTFDPLLEKFAPEKYQTLQEARKTNPNFDIAGIGAGLVGSIAAPFMGAIGTVGQGAKAATQAALGTGKLGTFAGRAAQGLAEGVAIGTPQGIAKYAVADDAAEDEAAAESIVAGGGFGLALGSLSGLLEVGRPIADKFGAYGLRRTKEFAASQRAKSAGMTLGISKQIIKKKGTEALDEAINYWEKSPLSSIWNTASDTKEAADQLLAQHGKAIGEGLKQIDQAVAEPLIKVNELDFQLRKIASSIPKRGSGYEAERNAAKQALEDFDTFISPPTMEENFARMGLSDAQEFKTNLNRLKSSAPKDAQNILGRMAEKVNDAIDTGVGKAKEYAPELSSKIEEGKYHYRNLKTLEPAIDNMVARMQNQTMSLSSWHAAGIGADAEGIGGIKTAGTLLLLNMLRREYGGAAGAYAASKAAQVGNRVGVTIGKIADTIVQDPYPKARLASIGLLTELTGKENRSEAADSLVQQLSQVNNNPELAANLLGQATDELSQYKQKTAFLAQQKIAQTARFLVEQAPKKQEAATPFQADVGYSDRDLSQFERQVSVAMNPISALEEMASGTIDPASLNALKTLYPRLYSKMQERIINAATENKRTYNMQQKTNLSMFLGGPVDTILSPQKIQALQANFNKKTEPPKKSGKKVSFSDNYKTQNERIEAR